MENKQWSLTGPGGHENLWTVWTEPKIRNEGLYLKAARLHFTQFPSSCHAIHLSFLPPSTYCQTNGAISLPPWLILPLTSQPAVIHHLSFINSHFCSPLVRRYKAVRWLLSRCELDNMPLQSIIITSHVENYSKLRCDDSQKERNVLASQKPSAVTWQYCLFPLPSSNYCCWVPPIFTSSHNPCQHCVGKLGCTQYLQAALKLYILASNYAV